ncbi:MAG: transglutaminase-like cysteine peptidase [Notoacmeibacter sp.]
MPALHSKRVASIWALAIGCAATLALVAPGQSEGTFIGQLRGSAKSVSVLGPLPSMSVVRPADQLERMAAAAPTTGGTLRKDPAVDQLATGAIPSSFFGTVAVAFANVSGKDDWNRVSKAGLKAGNCKSSNCKTRLETLQTKAQTAKAKSFHALLNAVNSSVNHAIAYAPDSQTYGRKDFWATPDRIVDKGIGDCEDFAILKRALLRQAGVPDKSMSLVILKDQQRGLYHAVLAVSTNKGHFILDNVRSNVFVDQTVSHYKPLLSFSADRSWIHGQTGKASTLVSSTSALLDIAPGESWAPVELYPAVSEVNLKDLRPSINY